MLTALNSVDDNLDSLKVDTKLLSKRQNPVRNLMRIAIHLRFAARDYT